MKFGNKTLEINDKEHFFEFSRKCVHSTNEGLFTYCDLLSGNVCRRNDCPLY